MRPFSCRDRRPQWQWHRVHHCPYFLPVGKVELDETEYLHLGLSITKILKCGCSLWDVAADLSDKV